MPASYIPRKLALFDTWSANFTATITASPGSYGLIAADAVAIAASVALFHAAYLLSSSPTTRSPVTVLDTHVQFLSCQAICRGYSDRIQATAGVLPADVAAAGLTVRATTRTPVPAPLTNPVLTLIALRPGNWLIGYKDSLTPTSKAKPYGAIQIEIAASVQATPVGTADLAMIIGLQTKSPMQIDSSAYAIGTPARIWSRWVTRRGFTGPWCVALNTVVA